jgi:organic radical activating enzyme
MSAAELAGRVFSSNPDGLTITGGDPLEQPDALLGFLQALHQDDIPENLPKDFLPRGIICFTGFTIEELEGSALACLPYIDLLIDGRYVQSLRYRNGLAGSSNQRFHFNQLPGRGESRLRRNEIEIDQSIEVHLDESNPENVIVTGFPTINRKMLRELGLTIEDV